MSNTCSLRITAAAGTKLAGTFFNSTIHYTTTKQNFTTILIVHHSRNIAGSSVSPLSKIPHCCLKISSDLISTPMWLYIRQNQLDIFGLVSYYHTNYPKTKISSYQKRKISLFLLSIIFLNNLLYKFLSITHPFALHFIKYNRLACVMHVASIHSEPELNPCFIFAKSI